MEIPPEVIANSLSGFCICYFKNATHDPEAPPHYHVTIPISDDSSLLLCIVTSQVDNKAWYYKKTNDNALASLVIVNKANLSFLKKESVIDCKQLGLQGRRILIPPKVIIVFVAVIKGLFDLYRSPINKHLSKGALELEVSTILDALKKQGYLPIFTDFVIEYDSVLCSEIYQLRADIANFK